MNTNRPVQESSTATALRITFAILAFFTFGLFVNTAAIGLTALNGDFWRNAFLDEEVRDTIRDQLDINAEDFIKVDNIDISIAGDDMADEFINIALDEAFDVYLYGDTKVDKERLYKFFDDYEGVIFRGYNPPDYVIEKAKRETYEMFEEKLKEAKSDFVKTDTYEAIHAFDRFSSGNTAAMLVSGIVTLVMFAVLILIHRNKFRPVRAMGITITVSQSCNFFLWLLIYFLFNAIKKKAKGEERFIQVFVDKLQGSVGTIVLAMFLLLLVGIGLIICGNIGINRVNRVQDDWE